jgi:uncharacterized protein YeaC (DUF1315 family)
VGAAASGYPWNVSCVGAGIRVIRAVAAAPEALPVNLCGVTHLADAAFIVAARNNWSALLDVVEAAQAALKRADIIGVWPDGHSLTFADMESALARLTDQSADGKEVEDMTKERTITFDGTAAMAERLGLVRRRYLKRCYRWMLPTGPGDGHYVLKRGQTLHIDDNGKAIGVVS